MTVGNNSNLKIAVMGAGLIGRRHIEQITREANLHSIVDPTDTAKELAEHYSCPWFASLEALLKTDKPDGIVIATPTGMHVENGLVCVSADIPILIEKPIADNLDEGEKLVSMAARKNIPILVGHHRRHNPIMQRARQLIDEGAFGNIVSVNAICWLYKPDDYYDVPWRRQKGAGPVLTNLIHDVDLLRYLCGEITEVHSVLSNKTREHAVEDSAAIALRFKSGALGTMSVSDTIVAPWSWELTSGENPAYPKTDQSCYQISGTAGSLSLPDLSLWHYGGEKSWWEPISKTAMPVENENPLALQIRHFCDVISGQCKPLVSGYEGLQSLRIIHAILNENELPH
jgi:predicted dehydrogenase